MRCKENKIRCTLRLLLHSDVFFKCNKVVDIGKFTRAYSYFK